MFLPTVFRAYGFHRLTLLRPYYEFRAQLVFRPERVWFDAEPGATLDSLRVGHFEELETSIPVEFLLRDTPAPTRELPVGPIENLGFDLRDQAWGYSLVLPTMEVGSWFSIRWTGTIHTFLVGGQQLLP